MDASRRDLETSHAQSPRYLLASRWPFKDLGEEVVEELASGARVVELKRGEHLFSAGASTEHLFVVLRGMLQLRRTNDREEHALVALFGPGGIPGVPILMQRPRYPVDALAVTPATSALRVPSAPLVRRLSTDVRVANAFNRALMDHCGVLQQKVEVLSAGSVEQRLAKLFSMLADTLGDELADGRLVVPVCLTRAEIASYVAARVETVIRTLSSWQKAGVLVATDDGFELPRADHLAAILVGDR